MKGKEFFTKEQRNAIYKKTLDGYKKSITVKDNYGICYALKCVLLKMIDAGEIEENLDIDNPDLGRIPESIDPYISLVEYPEILEQKPRFTHDNIFWFAFSETEKRIDIIENAITKTI